MTPLENLIIAAKEMAQITPLSQVTLWSSARESLVAAIESAERSPWTRCEDALPNFAQNVFVSENGRIFIAHRRELQGWVSTPDAYRCAPDAWQRLPEPFSE